MLTSKTRSYITEETATVEEIGKIIDAVEPVIEGCPKAHAIMACLAIAFISMYPDITTEQLQTGIKGVGEWVCLYIDSIYAPMTDKMKVN